MCPPHYLRANQTYLPKYIKKKLEPFYVNRETGCSPQWLYLTLHILPSVTLLPTATPTLTLPRDLLPRLQLSEIMAHSALRDEMGK